MSQFNGAHNFGVRCLSCGQNHVYSAMVFLPKYMTSWTAVVRSGPRHRGPLRSALIHDIIDCCGPQQSMTSWTPLVCSGPRHHGPLWSAADHDIKDCCGPHQSTTSFTAMVCIDPLQHRLLWSIVVNDIINLCGLY